MRINDIKLIASNPQYIDMIIIEGQTVDGIRIGRIIKGKPSDSNIIPIWLNKKYAIIKSIYITPEIGLYIAFDNPLDAVKTDKNNDINMYSSDADCEIYCNNISYN